MCVEINWRTAVAERLWPNPRSVYSVQNMSGYSGTACRRPWCDTRLVPKEQPASVANGVLTPVTVEDSGEGMQPINTALRRSRGSHLQAALAVASSAHARQTYAWGGCNTWLRCQWRVNPDGPESEPGCSTATNSCKSTSDVRPAAPTRELADVGVLLGALLVGPADQVGAVVQHHVIGVDGRVAQRGAGEVAVLVH